MAHINDNNRIADANSPEVQALINTNIRKAVTELAENIAAAWKEHPDALLEAHNRYFGN